MLFSLIVFATTSFASPQLWFESLGRSPVEIKLFDHSHLSAQSCRDCHKQEFLDWSKTRHASAWSNSIFQEGYLNETQDRCLHCHAPMQKQFDEIKKHGGGRLASEGVNCAVCHVRDNTMVGSKESYLWHPLKKEPAMKSPEFCAKCHQFQLEHTINGKGFATETVAQNTFEEWRSYQKNGGTKTCQQCHMPGGRHLFHGAHDSTQLRAGVSVTYVLDLKTVTFQIKSVDVGHNLPSGDVFRHLTFETATNGKSFQVVRTFGRQFRLDINDLTGSIRKLESENTAIKPGEIIEISIPRTKDLRYRLRYHFVSEPEKKRSHLREQDLVQVVLGGRI